MGSSKEIEKDFTAAQFAAKLHRLAEALEKDEKFEIQISGERVYMHTHAEFSIEYEKEDDEECLEFKVKWDTK